MVVSGLEFTPSSPPEFTGHEPVSVAPFFWGGRRKTWTTKKGPYFLGGGGIRGGTLDSHDVSQCMIYLPTLRILGASNGRVNEPV